MFSTSFLRLATPLLAAATVGTLNGNGVTTNGNGETTVQFNLGSTKDKSFIRAEQP